MITLLFTLYWWHEMLRYPKQNKKKPFKLQTIGYHVSQPANHRNLYRKKHKNNGIYIAFVNYEHVSINIIIIICDVISRLKRK